MILIPRLDQVALGWLSDTQREAHFTVDEVAKVIRSFPLGKAPRPDNLPLDLYKENAKILSPILACTNCLAEGALPDSMSHAHIVLIYKNPKDPRILTIS